MRRSYLKKAGIMILALIISFPLLLGLAGKAKAEEYDSNRYKMITVHAGEDGYFDDDPTIHTVEPWHIRYIDDPATAKEIMDAGITLEEYLGAVEPSGE